jgi:hypothetical protein
MPGIEKLLRLIRAMAAALRFPECVAELPFEPPLEKEKFSLLLNIQDIGETFEESFVLSVDLTIDAFNVREDGRKFRRLCSVAQKSLDLVQPFILLLHQVSSSSFMLLQPCKESNRLFFFKIEHFNEPDFPELFYPLPSAFGLSRLSGRLKLSRLRECT